MITAYQKPWEKLDPDNKLHLELDREVIKGHKLYGIKTIAIARRICDDSDRCAVVHLTWGNETDPIWPWTEIYTDIEEWKKNRMIPDVKEWNDFE